MTKDFTDNKLFLFLFVSLWFLWILCYWS